MNEQERIALLQQLAERTAVPRDQKNDRDLWTMPAHNKGKPMSAEQRAKMSADRQNISDEWRAKISAAKKGKPSNRKGAKLSAEQRAKISAAAKARVRKPHSAETRAKMRVSAQAAAANRRGKPAHNRGTTHTQEACDKISAAWNNKTEEQRNAIRAKMSASAKAREARKRATRQ